MQFSLFFSKIPSLMCLCISILAFAAPAASEASQADILASNPASVTSNGSTFKPSGKHDDWVKRGWRDLKRDNIETAMTTWQQGVNRLPSNQLLAFVGVYTQRSAASKQLKRLGLAEKAIIIRAKLNGKQAFYVLSARHVPSDKTLRREKLASLYKALHTSGTIFANAARKFQTAPAVGSTAIAASINDNNKEHNRANQTGKETNPQKGSVPLKSVKQKASSSPDTSSAPSIEVWDGALVASGDTQQQAKTLTEKNKTKTDTAVITQVTSDWIEQGWQQLDAKNTSAALAIWQQGVNALPEKQLLAFLGVYAHLNGAIKQAQRAGLAEKTIVLQAEFKGKPAYYIMSARHIPADKSMRREKLASLYQAIHVTDVIYANEAKKFQTGTAPAKPEIEVVTTEHDAGTFTISAFNFIGNSLIADETIRKELEPYTGKNKTRYDLIAAKQAILQLYRNEGFEMIAVGLPRKISSENISIRIVEVHIGQVSVSGKSKSASKSIKAAMSALRPGEVVNADLLNKQLREINQKKNIKSAQLVYHPTDQGLVDIEILVDEKNPMKFGLMASSLGTQETGRTLLTGIFHHNNVFNAGHELTVSYTASAKVKNLRLYSFLYQVPFETFDGKLILNLSRADVSSGQVLGVLNARGNGTIKSLHYEQTFFRTLTSRHYLDFGFEQHFFLEHFNHIVLPVAFSIGITARPVVLGYGYEGSTDYGEFGFRTSYHHNTPLGTNKDNASYRLLNPASFANWSFYRLSANYKYNWANNWSLSGKASGQLSNNALISGERFYITGLSEVRGFEEAEAFGDSAFFLRTQLTTPNWLRDTRFHAFVDAGRYKLNFPIPGELAAANIVSTGVGAHWTPAFGLDVLAEVGMVLNGLPVAPNRSVTGHFKVIHWFQ